MSINILHFGSRSGTSPISLVMTELTRCVARPPSKFHRTDLNRWRELFEVYIQSGIFFSTHELDHGQRNSTTAARQLQKFQSEVVRMGLVEKFKLPESRRALQRFVQINITLLQTLRFQEINQRAISKILKSESPHPHTIQQAIGNMQSPLTCCNICLPSAKLDFRI